MKIKICGITSAEDARAAVKAGADALGFMFYEPSPRCLSLEAARAIIRILPPFVAKVGVFVDAAEATVRQAAEACGLDTLQFHGRETPEFCRRFAALKIIKAFRIRDAQSLKVLPDYRAASDAWLLDSYVPGRPGGTGATFQWELACQARALNHPILLAGGLTPANVAEAVRAVQPYGLDVSSGVERVPGRKDPDKMSRFIEAARRARPSA